MRNLNRKYICIIIAFLIIIASPVYAIPKPNNDFYVYDDANLLNQTTERYIVETNIELYEKTGAQVVVATINDLEDMNINIYATELFEQWGIGGSQLDNGLLILIVPDDGEIWIEVGYGLEGVLPDGRTKGIVENNMIPYFSQGDYDTGVLAGYEEILDYIESEYNVELQARSGEYYNYNNNQAQVQSNSRIPNVFVIIGIIGFIFIDFRFFGGWLTVSLLRSLGRGGHHGGGGRGGSSGGGGRSGGGGAGGRW